MQGAPVWLPGAAAGFAVLSPEKQRILLDRFIDELRARGERRRDGLRVEDHRVFDAALEGLTARACGCRDACVPGAVPLPAKVLESLALDNRGIRPLEGLVLLSAKLAVRSVGIQVAQGR